MLSYALSQNRNQQLIYFHGSTIGEHTILEIDHRGNKRINVHKDDGGALGDELIGNIEPGDVIFIRTESSLRIALPNPGSNDLAVGTVRVVSCLT